MCVTCAVVDAGQYVGVGLDKPTPLQQQQQQQQQLNSIGSTAPGTNQQAPGSGTYSSGGGGQYPNGTIPAGPPAAAAAAGDAWHSNGSSITQPASGGGCFSSSGSSGNALTPRIFTFGIGPFCNHYFLKRLAGRVSSYQFCLQQSAMAGRCVFVHNGICRGARLFFGVLGALFTLPLSP
jgi:hypothetical protein